MKQKASPKRVRAKQKRLSPEDRRKEFVAKATEFFSEEGFGGGTRDLARRLGVTQPLATNLAPGASTTFTVTFLSDAGGVRAVRGHRLAPGRLSGQPARARSRAQEGAE